MPTFEDVARQAQGLTNLQPPMLLAVQWASNRVHELLGARRVAILRRNLELVIPGAIGQGITTPAGGTLLNVTQGSTHITGDATAQAAWATAPAHFPEGWFLRLKQAWYRVASASPTALTLHSPYFEDSVTAIASYHLVQRYHPLPENVYQLEEGSFRLARTGTPLTFINPTLLPMHSWGWHTASPSVARFVTEAEPGPGDVRQLELSPCSLQPEMLTYDAYIIKPDFTYTDPLPLGLDIQHIMPGLLADFNTWDASQPGRDAQTLSIILNEKARNLTRWEASKNAALMRLDSHQMRGFILIRNWASDSGPAIDPGIHSAYDHIWSRP